MALNDQIDGMLIDISGVLYVGDDVVPGAPEALKKLRETGLPVRFLTNTTRKTCSRLVAQLERLGFQLDESEVFSAPIAARRFIEREQLRPFLLVHPDLEQEFEGLVTERPNSVVVGDAGETFTYERLNQAFRILLENGHLIAMGANRYFREADGYSLDMGPFVEALRYASGVEPVVVGKPSSEFFKQALRDIGVEPGDAVMVGDDLENDIGGAQSAGVRGILVRTGKYRPEDELDDKVQADAICDDFPALIEELFPG